MDRATAVARQYSACSRAIAVAVARQRSVSHHPLHVFLLCIGAAGRCGQTACSRSGGSSARCGLMSRRTCHRRSSR
jgi:hypothetical protein